MQKRSAGRKLEMFPSEPAMTFCRATEAGRAHFDLEADGQLAAVICWNTPECTVPAKYSCEKLKVLFHARFTLAVILQCVSSLSLSVNLKEMRKRCKLDFSWPARQQDGRHSSSPVWRSSKTRRQPLIPECCAAAASLPSSHITLHLFHVAWVFCDHLMPRAEALCDVTNGPCWTMHCSCFSPNV